MTEREVASLEKQPSDVAEMVRQLRQERISLCPRCADAPLEAAADMIERLERERDGMRDVLRIDHAGECPAVLRGGACARPCTWNELDATPNGLEAELGKLRRQLTQMARDDVAMLDLQRDITKKREAERDAASADLAVERERVRQYDERYTAIEKDRNELRAERDAAIGHMRNAPVRHTQFCEERVLDVACDCGVSEWIESVRAFLDGRDSGGEDVDGLLHGNVATSEGKFKSARPLRDNGGGQG